MQTKISVIMPVFNTEKFVGEAIESILSQSFKDFEFIIIDDFSSDNSYKICEEYMKKDKRIRLYRNKKNMGIAFTKNRLIELSQTNYIATQDSDDISLKDRLEKEFKFLEENKGYSVIGGNNVIIDEGGKTIGHRKYSDNISEVILKKCPISHPSSMFRKDVFLELGGYDERLNYIEDYDLWVRMYLQNYKIKNLDSDLIKYRIRDGQTKSEKIKETIKNTIIIQKRAIKNGIKATISDRIYILLENILLIFPKSLILFLFKIIEYAKKG